MGKWAIVRGERALNANGLIKFFVGSHVSHTFTRIEDDQHRPVLELHGLYSSGWGAVFNTAAAFLTGRPIHSSRLHVLALTSERLMSVFTAHLPVKNYTEIRGPEDVVLRETECMLRGAREINHGKHGGIDYFFDLHGGGQTCHSVTAALFRRIGVNICKKKTPFDVPGMATKLEALDPELHAIKVDWTTPLDDIKASIARQLAEVSPDFKKTPLAWLQPKLPSLNPI